MYSGTEPKRDAPPRPGLAAPRIRDAAYARRPRSGGSIWALFKIRARARLKPQPRFARDPPPHKIWARRPNRLDHFSIPIQISPWIVTVTSKSLTAAIQFQRLLSFSLSQGGEPTAPTKHPARTLAGDPAEPFGTPNEAALYLFRSSPVERAAALNLVPPSVAHPAAPQSPRESRAAVCLRVHTYALRPAPRRRRMEKALTKLGSFTIPRKAKKELTAIGGDISVSASSTLLPSHPPASSFFPSFLAIGGEISPWTR